MNDNNTPDYSRFASLGMYSRGFYASIILYVEFSFNYYMMHADTHCTDRVGELTMRETKEACSMIIIMVDIPFVAIGNSAPQKSLPYVYSISKLRAKIPLLSFQTSRIIHRRVVVGE